MDISTFFTEYYGFFWKPRYLHYFPLTLTRTLSAYFKIQIYYNWLEIVFLLICLSFELFF